MNFYNKSNKEKIEENKFGDLKSDYILQIIFNNLSKKKSLEFIKYNKKIKSILNINTNDYKEYSEIYSSIEIVVIPVDNIDGKFININEEDEDIYYHIYFNNNKEEIKKSI